MKKLKIQEKVKGFSERLGVIVAIITSLTAISGAGIAACNWIVSTVNSRADERIDSLQKEMESNNKKQELATTRLELMSLIQYNPENIVEIEMLARKYFGPPLYGDSYMTSVVSKWCNKYKVDCTPIMQINNA